MTREEEIRLRWSKNIMPEDIEYLLKENQRLLKDVEYWRHLSIDQREDADAEVDSLELENQRLREALEHIREYWNGNENSMAMSDALYAIDDIAQKALTLVNE